MCESTPRAHITLPTTTHAPAVARRFLTDAFCAAHSRSVLEDAMLLTSETITNAVLYGGPPIVLAVECTESAMEIRVRDGSPELPRRNDPDEYAQHGRGLVLVDVLSDAWGVDAGPDGKAVWFRLSNTAR